jgi:hypothetical protein
MIEQSLGEVDITLRECPKCQRQNQPTRKYCTRCGANLLAPSEKEKPTTPEPEVVETLEVPIAGPVLTEDTPLVTPSKVETDRVIPPERHVEKTELEKAQETFARAEDVGITEEPGEGIVETRMLRASEVRELMDNAAEWSESETTQPSETTEGPETPTPPSMPTAADLERGILGARSEYVEKPEPVPEPSPPQPEFSDSPASASIPEPEPMVTPTVPKPVVKETTTAEVLPDVTAELWEYEAKVPDKDYLDDFNIKGMLSDVKNFLMELRQAESDLTSCSSQHDETVQQYRNVAEVKRISYESLEEQTKHAKEVWNDSEKEYRLADERRKKEISSREKRVDKIQKQIKKVESSLEKRVKELNKQKEKRAQEQTKKT